MADQKSLNTLTPRALAYVVGHDANGRGGRQDIATIIPPSLMGAVFDAWIETLPSSSSGLAVGDWWLNSGAPTKVTSL